MCMSTAQDLDSCAEEDEGDGGDVSDLEKEEEEQEQQQDEEQDVEMGEQYPEGGGKSSKVTMSLLLCMLSYNGCRGSRVAVFVSGTCLLEQDDEMGGRCGEGRKGSLAWGWGG